MDKPTNFDEVLSLWDSHSALSEELGVIYVTAQAMRNRRSIGDEHWSKIIEAWKRRGVLLTTDDLLRMKFKRREEKRREKAA